MIHEDRLLQILQIIESKQSVTVHDLRDKLYVSDATIRRDLTELARRGLILKSHGGAIATSKEKSTVTQQTDVPSSPVGDAAAELITDNSTVFISGGHLTDTMVDGILKHSGLTIVTDSSIIASVLCDRVDHLFCTGGNYISSCKAFGGYMATEFAEKMRYDFAFFSCCGIAPDNSITYDRNERALLLRTVKRLSIKNILLCDRSDFTTYSRVNVFKLSDMDIIVTDRHSDLDGRYKGLVIPV